MSSEPSATEVPDQALSVMEQPAEVVPARLQHATATGVVRTSAGWRVSSALHEPPTDDLTSAMVLADLLAADLGPQTRSARPARGAAPPEDEVDRLRLLVSQLEHALATRVTVEQATGVLAERRRCSPREAFESLSAAARSMWRRVHGMARYVVGSTALPPGGPQPVRLPPPLSRAAPTPTPAALAVLRPGRAGDR